MPQEYWRPKILFEIASGVGTPISIDDPTKSKVFGHYARELVDIDLLQNLSNQLVVERVGFSFYVGIDYERLSEFCSFCHSISHSVSFCKKKNDNGNQHDKIVKESKPAPKDKAIYVPKKSVNEKEKSIYNGFQ